MAPSGQHNTPIRHGRTAVPRAVGYRARATPFGPKRGRGSATATVLIRSPYSCWLGHRAWAPYSPQRTRHLRPLPGAASTLHGTDALRTHIDNILSIGENQAPSDQGSLGPKNSGPKPLLLGHRLGYVSVHSSYLPWGGLLSCPLFVRNNHSA